MLGTVRAVVERRCGDHGFLLGRKRRIEKVVIQPLAHGRRRIIIGVHRGIHALIVFIAVSPQQVLVRLRVDCALAQQKPRIRVEHTPLQRVPMEPVDRIGRIAVLNLERVVRSGIIAGRERTVLREADAAVFHSVYHHVTVLHVVLCCHLTVNFIACTAVVAVARPALAVRCGGVQRSERRAVLHKALRIAAEPDRVAGDDRCAVRDDRDRRTGRIVCRRDRGLCLSRKFTFRQFDDFFARSAAVDRADERHQIGLFGSRVRPLGDAEYEKLHIRRTEPQCGVRIIRCICS